MKICLDGANVGMILVDDKNSNCNCYFYFLMIYFIYDDGSDLTMKSKLFNFIFFCFLTLLFFSVKDVHAYTPVEDDCLDKGTCILVCNYNNVSKGSNNRKFTRNISLYYYLDSEEWKLYWEGSSAPNSGGSKFSVHTKGPSTLGHIFSNNGENVYFSSQPDASKFKCFDHAYLDYSNLLNFNEVCFDNNGKTCKSKYNGVGTAFKANDYISDEQDYDFEDDLTNYVSHWSFGDISCDDIFNNSVDINSTDYVSSKFDNDLKTNYLHGYDVPDFIANNDILINSKEQAKTAVENKKAECLNQIQQSVTSGEITTDEANRRQEIVNGINSDQVAENFQNAAIKTRDENMTINNWNQTEVKCEDIFKFDEEGSVGWILQTLFNYIKVIGPIAVILLSSLDFIKAVVGTDEKAMKEAQSKLIIRLVAAAALFLIPTLLQLLLNIINIAIQPECFLR